MKALLEKLRALRELANGTTNEHEAKAAARQAARLAEKYRISEAEIEAGDEKASSVVLDDAPVLRGGALPSWKKFLVHTIAHHFGCVMLIGSAWRGPQRLERTLRLVGRAEDIALARETIPWLLLQVAVLCQAAAATMVGRGWQPSFCLGAAVGIREQLAAGRAEAREGASPRALVRLDQRVKQAEDAINEGNAGKMKARTERLGSLGNSRAFWDGRHAGRKVPITATASERREVRAVEGAP